MKLMTFFGFFSKLKYMNELFFHNLCVCLNNIKGKIKKYNIYTFLLYFSKR